MTTLYNLGRIPIDAAGGVANILTWPLHFGKTIATNTADTAFKVVGTSTEDVPKSQASVDGSIYDMAKSNADIAGMIYYYTELRSETRRLLKNFAVDKGLSYEIIPGKNSALEILRAQIREVEKYAEILRSPESTSPEVALRMYKDAMANLANLQKRYNLDDADIEYFDILKEPKKLTDVKSDLIKFDNFIDPQFRFAFGGEVYNRKNIEDMIDENEDMFIYKIDDDFNTTSLDIKGAVEGFNAEVVYAIVVDNKLKRITVVFRGSVNASDWMSNVQCVMCDFKLPGYISPDDEDKKVSFGKAHQGFYKYLCNKTMAGADGRTLSKSEEIMGDLEGLLNNPRYADFSVYVTGHSLGGALSTMFSFRAAALGTFKKPITNVSFASPFVGDEKFRENFIDLERKRKVRHLRISNYQDVVTLIPATTLPGFSGIGLFKHVGMNIRLYGGGDLLAPSYRRFYPKLGSFTDGLRNAMHANLMLGLSPTPIKFHLMPEYNKRIENKKTVEELSKLTLDELYANEKITGWAYVN
eukprot:jgi/Psemu1/14020/gm1.14020_g